MCNHIGAPDLNGLGKKVIQRRSGLRNRETARSPWKVLKLMMPLIYSYTILQNGVLGFWGDRKSVV